jgi:hypothetical protein
MLTFAIKLQAVPNGDSRMEKRQFTALNRQW